MLRKYPWLPYAMQMLDADDGKGAGGGNAAPNTTDDGDDDDGGSGGDTGGGTEQPISLTQAALDKLISKRLGQAEKKWKADQAAEVEAAQLSEADKLKADLDAEKKRTEGVVSQANQRAVRAEAKVAAAELGIKAERIAYALKLADLSDVEVDDDGEPDAAAIKAALEAVIKDIPELAGSAGGEGVGKGSNPGTGNAGTKNPWLKENFNLTEQARILREKPALAQQFMTAAKG